MTLEKDSPFEGDDQEIRWRIPAVTQKLVDDFRTATWFQLGTQFPPTFPTVFRRSEFEWLARKQVNMRYLLHTEQDYEYRNPFRLGEELVVSSRIAEEKQRGGMKFVTIESHISSGAEIKVISRSSFVVRTPPKEGA